MDKEAVRVVMMNIQHCWLCKQYLPPDSEIRVRQMKTAVEIGMGHVDRYEPVSLCVSCDIHAAKTEQQEQERYGQVLGGIVMFGVFCLTAGLPWPVAIIGAVILGKLRVLGVSLIALVLTCTALSNTIGQRYVEAHSAFIVVGVIGCVIVGSYVWRRRQHYKSIAVRREAALVR